MSVGINPAPVNGRSTPQRLKVFVSSVMGNEDLSTQRDATIQAIASLELTMAWAFEYSPAEPSAPRAVYLREIEDCDLVVLIVSNSHSAAVQAELNAAEAYAKPLLGFVHRLPKNSIESKGRKDVLRWLGDRCKYQYFIDVGDLRSKVIEAVAAELVRGYKQYRIALQDYGALLEGVGSPRSLILRDAQPGDLEAIREALMELKTWYPDVTAWIARIIAELNAGLHGVRIAEIGREIAGIALSREKDSQVRKFSTLYVRPGFRGDAIGPHLVYEEVKRAARDGVREAYVTFAHELRPSLQPILSRYGFVTTGISPARYRPGAAEWVMGKTFCYAKVVADDFTDFIVKHFVSDIGASVEMRERDHLQEDRPLLRRASRQSCR
jgi:GNAT superfamily N-acetyltransferase